MGHGSLFHTLAGLLHAEGVHIDYGHLDDDATWDPATRTLTLRADASPTTQACSLSEFCRRWHLGPTFSRFVDNVRPRHLHAVT